MAARIRAALQRGDDHSAAVLLDDLLGILEPHARREEQGLFAALADDEDLCHIVPQLVADHAALHHPSERSEAAIAAFLDTLAAHIDREEHDVFPAAIQLLPASAWDDALRRSVTPIV